MSFPIMAISSSSPAQETSHVPERRSANFHPSIWRDYFLKYASDSNSMSSPTKSDDRIEKLKGEVRKMLIDAIDKPSQKLNLIDQIQRVGIAYHFEIEINQQLEQIHESYFNFHSGDKDISHDNIFSHVLFDHSKFFNKFKDSNGNFSESLIADVQGLLSLFEACHTRFHGDDVLNDALAFTMTHLKSIDEGKASPNLKKQVSHALNQPIHKGIPRLEARHYIPLYQEEPSHNEVLLALAKLDFNLLQEQHQKELGNLTRWWKNLDVERKFPFARDRLVEMYLWMSIIYFESDYEAAREILTKVASMVSIIDDIYDVHGMLEELGLFTEAIESWDVNAKEGLPEYMQACYKTVLDLYDEIGYEVTRKGRSYRLFYAKEAMKNQVRAYFAEAKWFHQNYVPTMEEYMPIALATAAIELLLVTLLLGMEDFVTKDAFDWLLYGNSKMVKAVKLVGRLMDDIAGHKFEQERGHGPSSVECFMKQYKVTEEEAKKELRKQVADAWKDINEGLRCPTIVPRPLLVRILNFARAMHVLYKDEIDIYTHAGTKLEEHVTSLYVNPLPM
ncbi:hypothetical protein ACJRO7_016460 [Eucalyptus globulus]|uniref:Uncharacterized protein n=1 Tax=Eucalyptus globulus TaxID=34317 RepID=A0ABD3L815_EUCGL